MKVTIASWNIGCSVVNDSPMSPRDATDYICDIITKNSIDILLLQEFPIHQGSNYVTAQDISTKSPLQHFVIKKLSRSHLLPDSDMGLAVFSRFNIQNEWFFKLCDIDMHIVKNGTTYTSHDKGFISCYIPALDTYVITGHCPAFKFFGKSPYDFITPLFEELDSELDKYSAFTSPVIVGADFNAQHLPDLLPKFTGKFNSMVTGATRPSGVQTDYIFTLNTSPVLAKIIPAKFDHNCCIACISLSGEKL